MNGDSRCFRAGKGLHIPVTGLWRRCARQAPTKTLQTGETVIAREVLGVKERDPVKKNVCAYFQAVSPPEVGERVGPLAISLRYVLRVGSGPADGKNELPTLEDVRLRVDAVRQKRRVTA